jgi:hypothetical protein
MYLPAWKIIHAPSLPTPHSVPNAMINQESLTASTVTSQLSPRLGMCLGFVMQLAGMFCGNYIPQGTGEVNGNFSDTVELIPCPRGRVMMIS